MLSTGLSSKLLGTRLLTPSPSLVLSLMLAGRLSEPSTLTRPVRVATSSGTSSTSIFWIVRTDGRETGFQCRLRRGKCAERREVRMLDHSGEVRKAGEDEYVQVTAD